jgi:Domain of unknown function (DUF4111)
VPIEVGRREEREGSIGQDGLLLVLRIDPEDDNVGVPLARRRVDRVRARISEEQEAAAADLVDGRALLGDRHARQAARNLMDVFHGRRPRPIILIRSASSHAPILSTASRPAACVTIGSELSITIDELPHGARKAWTRLRDELRGILGDGLVAMWAHGGSIAPAGQTHAGDLDTHVILSHRPDEATARRLDEVQDAIADDLGVELDTWYILGQDARRSEPPHHAYREGKRDTSWAIHRAHWLAGRYLLLHGTEPAEIVPAPTWKEIEPELSRELEHIERHIVEGDTDPYEATYAILNGSRILYTLETHNAAFSKREAGEWALDYLPDRWQPALQAAIRAYAAQATPEDETLLASEMMAFIAMVRERLPAAEAQRPKGLPRWSGY